MKSLKTGFLNYLTLISSLMNKEVGRVLNFTSKLKKLNSKLTNYHYRNVMIKYTYMFNKKSARLIITYL